MPSNRRDWPDIEVRPATASDHPRIVELAREVMGSDYQVHSRHQFHVVDGDVLVAERSAALAGFLTYSMEGDDCEVMAVACREQRAGAGTALMHAAHDIAVDRKCRRIWLVTTDANIGAQRFYEHLG